MGTMLYALREAIIPFLPDIDRPLNVLVKGTGLLQGGLSDYLLALIIALLFPVFRYILDKTIFDTLGRRALGFPKYKKSDDPITAEQLETLEKFKESEFKCGVQITLTLFLIIVAVPKAWFIDSSLFWKECERLPCVVQPTLGERFIYCLELGFYIQALPMLFLWETKRRDRLENFAHHVATIILIGYSYYINVLRVGIMVLICHEANDIFLEAAKMARYAKARDLYSTGFFVTFMLSWFVTRMYYYLVYVINSCIFESRAIAEQLNVNVQPHFGILNCFLLFLYCLHIYWSYLIVRIAVRQITHGEIEDIREQEDEDTPKPAKAYKSTTLPEHKHAQSVGSLPSSI